jgi:hypothetical protein
MAGRRRVLRRVRSGRRGKGGGISLPSRRASGEPRVKSQVMPSVDTPKEKAIKRRWEVSLDRNWREAREEIVKEEMKTNFRVNVVAGEISVQFKQMPTPEERALLREKGFTWKPVKKAWEKQYSGLFDKDFTAKHKKAVDEGRQLIGLLKGRGLFYYALPERKDVVAVEIWE